MTQAEVARIVGCSPSTVHRAVKRQMQLRAGAWPPAVSNGFGLSYAKRRALRLRQGMEQETYPSQMAAPGVNAYEMPPELQSRYDENGDEAW
jgi:transposase-like protein